MILARLSAALVLATAAPLAFAQVYAWKDPLEGVTRVSNDPPPWYDANAPVKGPVVVVTRGQHVIDDTSLSLEERGRLARRFAPRPAPARLEPPTPTPGSLLRGVGGPDRLDATPLPIKPVEE